MEKITSETPLTVGLLIEFMEKAENPGNLLPLLKQFVETPEERAQQEHDAFEGRAW